MNPKNRFRIRVLLFEEEVGNCKLWVAQGLEYDIVAQGKTIEAARTAFERTFMTQVCIDIEHERKPFQSVGRAPQPYFAKFKAAIELKKERSLKLPKVIPAHTIGAPRLRVRIYAY